MKSVGIAEAVMLAVLAATGSQAQTNGQQAPQAPDPDGVSRSKFSPGAERELVTVNPVELRSRQRSGNSAATNLLPERSRLVIPHEKVLVVDAIQMKSQG
jgi:hypothetical protein